MKDGVVLLLRCYLSGIVLFPPPILNQKMFRMGRRRRECPEAQALALFPSDSLGAFGTIGPEA